MITFTFIEVVGHNNCQNLRLIYIPSNLLLAYGIEKFEINVDVQKRPLRFSQKFDNKCVSFIQFKFSSLLAIW